MFLLSRKPKLALTASSVITAVNLEQFLALPTFDTEMGGTGWNLYFGFCKLQSANVASSLTTLNARQVANYDERYNVNFPHLLKMLMDDGLTLEQIGLLLAWYRTVAEANFNGECFVSEAREGITQALLRINSVPERLDQIGELITRLSPVKNWRWLDALIGTLRHALPQASFTHRVIASCVRSATDYNEQRGVSDEKDLRLLLKVLKQIFEQHG